MPTWSNYTVNWFWAYFSGATSQADWDKYIANATYFMNNCLKPSIALHIIYKAEPINAVQRNQISDVINTATNAKLIAGNAIVTDSMFTRGILTAINWIAKKPYTEKVFAHPNDARPWFESLIRERLCTEMYRDMLSKLPLEGRWEGMDAPAAPSKKPA